MADTNPIWTGNEKLENSKYPEIKSELAKEKYSKEIELNDENFDEELVSLKTENLLTSVVNATKSEYSNKLTKYDQDMIRYDWDENLKAWFPSEDQTEFDRHLKTKSSKDTQSFSNGNISQRTSNAIKNKTLEEHPSKEDKQKNSRKNTSIYIKGLPNDVTVDELNDYFGKCGIIMDSLYTEGQPRIKIYFDDEGNPKGDAMITFLMEESVELAVSLFDQSQFRQNCQISVEPADFSRTKTFSNSTNSGPSIPNKHLIKASFDKMKKRLDWGNEDIPNDSANVHLYAEGRVVLLRGMFSKEEIDRNPSIAFDIKSEVRDECSKSFGRVSNVKIFPAVPGGLMTVKFKEATEANSCIDGLDGRWFDGKRIGACLYDGKLLRNEESI